MGFSDTMIRDTIGIDDRGSNEEGWRKEGRHTIPIVAGDAALKQPTSFGAKKVCGEVAPGIA
jgi:hypothetical protein